nr:MAG TPA_asm: hypothetical protein [Caudoviricetes sp.]
MNFSQRGGGLFINLIFGGYLVFNRLTGGRG